MAGLLLFTQACSKNNDTKIKVQDHDKNEMMSIMHSMMTKMMAMPMTMDPDNSFAMMMRLHHQGAIDMANLELKSGDDAKMKEVAQMIITTQTAEIQEFTVFLNAHPAHANVPEYHEQHMSEMKRSEMQADLQVINGDIDHDFAMLMIGHHQSALESSRMELIYGHETAMKNLAKKMIQDQEKEIKVLQEWLLSDGK